MQHSDGFARRPADSTQVVEAISIFLRLHIFFNRRYHRFVGTWEPLPRLFHGLLVRPGHLFGAGNAGPLRRISPCFSALLRALQMVLDHISGNHPDRADGVNFLDDSTPSDPGARDGRSGVIVRGD